MTDGNGGGRQRGIRQASEMAEPEVPEWLAIGWLQKAAVNVLVGDEGIGKSLWWVTVAMHVTTGIPLPELRLPKRMPGDVVVIATEDGWAEVRARLQTAGADLEHVHLFADADDDLGVPQFPDDEVRFREWTDRTGIRPALVVVDAWLDTVKPGVQVKAPQGARQAIEPWKRIAKHLGAAVLLMAHTNRLDSANIRDRIGSTGALRQVARVLLFAARHPDDGRDDGPMHLWIGPEKANGAQLGNAVRFELSIEQARTATASDPGTVATLVAPRQETQRIAHLVADWTRVQQEASRPASKAQQAEAWLLAFMGDRREVPAADVKSARPTDQFGSRALEDAMKALGRTRAAGFGGVGMYSLSSQPEPALRGANTADTAEPDAQSSQSPQSRYSAVSAIR